MPTTEAARMAQLRQQASPMQILPAISKNGAIQLLGSKSRAATSQEAEQLDLHDFKNQ
ncbi:hypothetical protein [Glutamicibacter halophytocola]|uniref:hypothetical protein n=1 Tax=Glutamicibacter halophytocola TaxID=1933880 RepID=UPI0015C5733C|nr:hypothetical protein [Glutamicibacter halophytocola]NQD41201.1 hypothetical protein [Glutamicibacter halophytocola]